MASIISWLDFSEEDQRKANEVMKFYANKDTVDDLGIGTVRDAISNSLFPGTSVVQTRARYFLFVPWLFKEAERRHPYQLVDKTDNYERKLIEALRNGGDTNGLIGVEAGIGVKILPSAIYWTGLSRYGIFLAPSLTIRQYGRHVARGLIPADTEDEIADRSISFWQRDIPDPPSRLFDFDETNFDLMHEEAEWLCERIISSDQFGQASLLSAYVRDLRRGQPSPQVDAVWDVALPPDCPDPITQLVHHAERFSCAVLGAALLYNVMLAETLANNAPTDFEWRDDLEADIYLELLDEWHAEAVRIRLAEWAMDIDAFWDCVLGNVVRIPQPTQRFLNQWAAILSEAPKKIASSKAARELITKRELEHKRGQARLVNKKRLGDWSGRAGIRPLTFRWTQVRDILSDIADGLNQSEPMDDHAVA